MVDSVEGVPQKIARPVQTVETPKNNAAFLYPKAQPRTQIEACVQTLHNFSHITDEAKKSRLQQLSSIAQIALNRESIGEDLASRIVTTTVGLLDLDFMDEIGANKKFDKSRPGFSYYGREIFRAAPNELPGLPFKNIQQAQFMTASELGSVIKGLSEHKNVATSITDLEQQIRRNKDNSWVLNALLSKEDLQKTSQLATKYNVHIAVPVSLNEQYGGIIIFSNDEDISETFIPEFGVRSNIPRHEIWEAALQGGNQLLESTNNATTHQESDSPTQGISTTQYTNIDKQLYEFVANLQGASGVDERKRKLLRLMLHEPEQEDINKLLGKHEQHYNRLLGNDRKHSQFGNSQTILTRSGVSANEAAIKGLASYLRERGEKIVYDVTDGFYYESYEPLETIPTRKRKHVKDEEGFYSYEPPEAEFLIFEPNSPQFKSFGAKKNFDSQREMQIRSMKKRALAHPEKTFYLFMDKTSDPLYETFNDNNPLPQNMIIIETTSLTKHERGERNFAFGAITVWGESTLTEKIRSALTESKGELTPWGITHLPRITRKEVEETQAHFIQLGKQLEAAFGSVEETFHVNGMDYNLGWHISPYTYFAFIQPPDISEVSQLYQHLTGKQGYSGFGKTSRDFDQFYREYTAVDLDVLDKLPNVARGDSFGLSETRLTYMPNWEDSEVGNVLRISFGRTATSEEMEQVAQAMKAQIEVNMVKLKSLQRLPWHKRQANRFTENIQLSINTFIDNVHLPSSWKIK